MTEEQKIHEAYVKYGKVHNEYLQKFGEHSLDYAIYTDPLDFSVKRFERNIKILSNAIKKNKPLPNDPPTGEIEVIY